ncbi:MAG: dTMP kinase [Parvibaculales bacterium]
MTAGRFISFEGGEGAGKSTQIKHVASFLKANGHQVLTTRQPGGTENGQALRDLLVNGAVNRWPPMAEALLMLADRAVHLEEMIRPALAQGQWVLCDRYMDSTRAYQGVAGALGLDVIDALQAPIVQDTVPDLTFLLDLDVAKGLQRASERGGAARFENKGKAYHEEIRRGFLTLAKAETDRFVVIDAAQPVEQVTSQIIETITARWQVSADGR